FRARAGLPLEPSHGLAARVADHLPLARELLEVCRLERVREPKRPTAREPVVDPRLDRIDADQHEPPSADLALARLDDRAGTGDTLAGEDPASEPGKAVRVHAVGAVAGVDDHGVDREHATAGVLPARPEELVELAPRRVLVRRAPQDRVPEH